MDPNLEIEEIRCFMELYRQAFGIVIGSPVPDLPQESEGDYYLFVVLPRQQDDSLAELRRDASLRQAVHSRVRFEQLLWLG